MITVRLKGGLGNQLFQYATARALAEHHHTQVAFDLGFLTDRLPTAEHTFRNYELDVFGIQPISPPILERIAFNITNVPARKLMQKIAIKAISGCTFYEKTLSYNAEIFSKTSSKCYINGYFPSEKYFYNYVQLLRSELKFIAPPPQPIADRIQSTQSVSLHIRRGDYITNKAAQKFHGLCSLDYYQSAINYLSRYVNNLELYVFSDDLEWVQQNLQSAHPVFYVEGNTGKNSYQDMQLMSLCHYHILANSSFSWWGAWLNPNPDKIVIAPQRWFADDRADKESSDIIPEGWVRI